MFNHIVTAAKGLFARHPEEHSAPVEPANSNMVTSTRRGDVTPNISKRKSRPTSAGKPDSQETKRQKSDPQGANPPADTSSDTETPNVNAASAPAPAGKKIRFGSEEPEPIETEPEETPEAPQDDEDEDSDDDAPETIDNSAQLSKMKEQAKKQEAARQLYVSRSVLAQSILLTISSEKKRQRERSDGSSTSVASCKPRPKRSQSMILRPRAQQLSKEKPPRMHVAPPSPLCFPMIF